jgi:hypothetical protein
MPVVLAPTQIRTYEFGAGTLVAKNLGGYAANALGLINPEDWYSTREPPPRDWRILADELWVGGAASRPALFARRVYPGTGKPVQIKTKGGSR